MTAASSPRTETVEPSAPDALEATFHAQKRAFAAEGAPDRAVRRNRLERLLATVEQHDAELVEAMAEDFRHRSPVESAMLDINLSIGDIRESLRHLSKWMAPRRVGTRLHLRPARSRLIPQPLGVVGVISPWNFPVYLAFAPLSAALAAGNRVMLKPSELTPRTSEVMKRAIAEVFAPEEVSVVTGDADVGRAFSALPFDHILFTGSTAVGRHVARAAAENLTPVTLELGGKSPAIVTPSADVASAAEKVVYGKSINSGQICVAPDYALVPREQVGAFVEAARATAKRFYPTRADNPDYTCIVSDRHFERLEGLIEDARAKGARVVPVEEGADGRDRSARKMGLTMLLDTTPEMKVMQQEIFGPILPVIPYDSLAEAIDYVNERERPLSLYVFARSTRERDEVLDRTFAGGVTVNDTLWHVANDAMHFGGVGASGMGAYHGERGFETFSHLKPVLYQPRVNGIPLFYPPYGKTMDALTRALRKLI